MRNSLRGLSIALAAGVSLSALAAGVAAQPVPQGDVGQQQSRVDALQSKAESLRQEAQQLGGSRDVQTSLRRVEGRIEEFDKHADTLEETAGNDLSTIR